jgi:hypothetical protein
MSSSTYFVDLEGERIVLPDSRWYRSEFGTFPGVTSVLQMKAKPGLSNWQIMVAMNGIDPKSIGREAMDEGSAVHDACEKLMKGNELSFFNAEGNEQFKFWEEWMPICRFKEAYDKLAIKPLLIEQTIINADVGYAGTLDLLCGIQPDPKKKERVLAVIDLKRAKSATPEYLWQVATYIKAVQWLYKNVDSFNKALVEMGITQEAIDNLKGYLLLLNVESKSGWRLTEVQDIDRCFDNFKACLHLFKDEKQNFEYAEQMYPTKISLKGETEDDN